MESQVRPVRGREELEQCFELWGDVFDEDRGFFQRRLEGDRTYDSATTWVAVVGGEVVSAAQISPLTRAGMAPRFWWRALAAWPRGPPIVGRGWRWPC